MTDLTATGNSPRRISWGPRLIAPLALLVALIALVVVITGSVGIDDKSTDATTEATTGNSGAHDGAETPRTYVVESGDLYSTIAEKFGVSVERLERLNPDIDPQTLNPGVELTIR